MLDMLWVGMHIGLVDEAYYIQKRMDSLRLRYQKVTGVSTYTYPRILFAWSVNQVEYVVMDGRTTTDYMFVHFLEKHWDANKHIVFVLVDPHHCDFADLLGIPSTHYVHQQHKLQMIIVYKMSNTQTNQSMIHLYNVSLSDGFQGFVRDKFDIVVLAHSE